MDLPLPKKNSDQGDFFELKSGSGTFHFGFGNRFFSIEDLKAKHPDCNIHQLKQVHGVSVVSADVNPIVSSTALPEADGHWTKKPKNILTIQTADCLPVLVLNPNAQFMMALHAGWRGLFAGIVAKALSTVDANSLTDCMVFAGPHIQEDSFEVKEDVFPKINEGLERTPSLKFSDVVKDHKDGRHFVSMKTFLLAELLQCGIHQDNIWVSPTNTVTSKSHFSYRRQKGEGRLISYVALL